MTRGIRNEAEMIRLGEHRWLTSGMAYMMILLDEEGMPVEWEENQVAAAKDFLRKLKGKEFDRLEACRMNFFSRTKLRRRELQLLSAQLQGVMHGATLLSTAELRQSVSGNETAGNDSETSESRNDE